MGFNTSDIHTTKNGTWRLSGTADNTGLQVYSICPEEAAAFDNLEITLSDNTVIDAIAVRDLGSMSTGITYVAGYGAYFSRIKMSAGALAVNK